ncbi:hypothetical protein E2C01_074104 [Portunus trituberculatus]|uniref:Uncharacterized protein n=1 Tax=Portunus trituberculatus TaxID=210409 RepID=A0A5B7I754_PORTR|nr:hypothetical protein [Portunus trituberculatus]
MNMKTPPGTEEIKKKKKTGENVLRSFVSWMTRNEEGEETDWFLPLIFPSDGSSPLDHNSTTGDRLARHS